ncbi:MAG: hypothetical protein JNM66_01355 [Bryobacterales bacterium]|nr:hypothetical protein [Bryobacterales bacterium]
MLKETVPTMEVHLSPELEQKLNDLALLSGRSADVWVHDAVAGLVDDLAETRATLDGRFDDIKSGKVKLISGDEAFARLRERIASRRSNAE